MGRGRVAALCIKLVFWPFDCGGFYSYETHQFPRSASIREGYLIVKCELSLVRHSNFSSRGVRVWSWELQRGFCTELDPYPFLFSISRQGQVPRSYWVVEAGLKLPDLLRQPPRTPGSHTCASILGQNCNSLQLVFAHPFRRLLCSTAP